MFGSAMRFVLLKKIGIFDKQKHEIRQKDIISESRQVFVVYNFQISNYGQIMWQYSKKYCEV